MLNDVWIVMLSTPRIHNITYQNHETEYNYVHKNYCIHFQLKEVFISWNEVSNCISHWNINKNIYTYFVRVT